ncbi:STREFT protein [Mycoplasma putrefaciens]|uniref:STREFT protein n=1 Tax=Mycoplasma putrefaciens TaxID=2123 RepID=UPI003DA407B0
MFKKLKILKKWYIPILTLLVFISTFLGFILSYTESKKQSLMTNIENYVRLSSYAVRGKILKDQEGINKNYVNQILANKKITDEFGSSFIWKDDSSSTSNQDIISNLLQTYFGKSIDLFTDNIKYLDKKDKNKLKDINNTNSQNIIPDNINNFIGVVNSAKKFISGLSSSTINLGINLLQRNLLRTTKEVEAIKNNNTIKSFVKAIESNQNLISIIADTLISSSDEQIEPNFYQNLTVRQLFNKHLNTISEVITSKKYFNHDQDNLANDLVQYFWQEIINLVKKEFANSNDILSKIKNILKAINKKFDFKKLLKKILPSLIRYLKTELFFATYYVVNPKLTIAELLNQSTNAQQFKVLTNGGLDLGVLLKGLSLVFQNQNSGKRFLDFIFKKVDADKIYFTSNNQPINIGTGNLLFDILNAVQSALLSTTGALSFVIPKIEDYIDKHKENIKKLITDNLTNLLKKILTY